MSTTPSTLAAIRSPIVDKNGMPTWTFLQKLLEYERKLQNTINLLGEIASGAKVQGSAETIDNRIWQTQAMRDAAVDVNGNLLLKNKDQSTATTSTPTAPTSFATMPEMTRTITTLGNDVLILFSCDLHITAHGGGASDIGQFRFKRGSTVIGITAVESFDIASTLGLQRHISFNHLDIAPAAGAHTYVVEWKASSGTTLKSQGLVREMQVVELG